MTLLEIIKLTDKTYNGLLWGTFFTITTVPLQLGIHYKFIKKLNTDDNFKYKLSKETFKLLFLTSSLTGFVYGYNTSKKLTHYFKY
tara:strand:- start:324 stop:581 length:258 start_codon:yes stop_codon:yes gene_type:complete